jgi:Na+/proline symporter
MVENAYQVTLVTAFIPLAFGVYWKKATNQGAILSIFSGFVVWIGTMFLCGDDPFIPAQFAGLIASFVGMLVGSLLPQYLRHDYRVHDDLHAGKHGHESFE